MASIGLDPSSSGPLAHLSTSEKVSLEEEHFKTDKSGYFFYSKTVRYLLALTPSQKRETKCLMS